MSQYTASLIKSFKSEVDLSGKQYFFAMITGDNTINVADGSVKPVGVIITPAKTGKSSDVIVLGTAKVVVKKNADDALPVAGDYIISDANGYGIKRTTETVDLIRGIALESASAEGDIIEILLV